MAFSVTISKAREPRNCHRQQKPMRNCFQSSPSELQSPASSAAEQTVAPYLPRRFSAADWMLSLRAGRASPSRPCRSQCSAAPPLGKSRPGKETDNGKAGEKSRALPKRALTHDHRQYLTGPHRLHEFFIESISVLFKKALTLVFHLCMEKEPLIPRNNYRIGVMTWPPDSTLSAKC